MAETARYRQVAAEVRAEARAGAYGAGGRLPSEEELAARYSVSRGTVRQALSVLRAEGVVTSRRGTRRVVLAAPPLQSFAELMSFTRWARSLGESPGGRVVRQERRAAGPEESAQLRLPEGSEVHWVLRLRTLADRPVMVERTSYPPSIGALVAAMPPDTVSVSEALEHAGVLLADADHTVDLAFADEEDAALLGCPVGTALLRERRRSTDPAGVPVEWSDDRYLPGTVAFTVHNSLASTALSRHRTDSE
ncbi:GntR family transcriptional regulator [Streptacidiphilus sp. PB12-B1b]|uniref:GntR family transcriptional regulator n=1 Tax=Streptacidiphilus sp. PB12-B1b TaxID=2705012 RepID=UPI0015FD7100|nr:GntR family transcriptional regulator [Streptacidiphilus sp. PB12-B1b]QMU77649.1 GntR family transcriptional regulator [Streptacidiphilus sp. PB12-B1b]